DPMDENKPRGALASQLDILVPDVELVTASSFLVGLSGRYAGKLFKLAEGEWIIGRSDDALVRLDEKAVSHRHAKLVVRGGKCVLFDLGTTNGTHVNDMRMEESVELHTGD